ncbi:calpain 7, partial [Naganishia albida]
GFRRERTWARITEGWERGTVLVTLGTGAGVGRNSVRDARLVPLHAYAVIDIHRDTDAPSDDGKIKGRMMRVLNPWKRGRTRMDDGRAWTRDMLESLVEEPEDEEAEEPPDLWWMTWDEVCDTFDTVNLNWDTRIFANSETVHGVYSVTDGNEPISVTVAAPSSGSEVWFLLQR